MNGEGKKTNLTMIIMILGFALIFLLIIFALFSSPPTGSSSLKGGLDARFNGNTNLKSGGYFDLNFSIINSYDVLLENIKVWVEAGKIFTINANPISRSLTLKTYPHLPTKSNITYFFSGIKVEKLDAEIRNVPIILKIQFVPIFVKNFTINVANNNTLHLYGGFENVGIKEKREKSLSPLSVYFSHNSKDFVFEEGKRNFAAFKIIIENTGGGRCVEDAKIKVESSRNLICYYKNESLVAPFETSHKIDKKFEIPCNFTLSYLREKDFDSVSSSIQVSCEYLEEKTFRFNIIP